MHNKKMLAVLAAAAFTGLVACENTAQGVKQDAKENAADAKAGAAEAKAETADERAEIKQEGREAGAAVGEAAREAGSEIKEAAGKAGDALSGAVRDVSPAGDAAQQTLDVKTALMADKSVDASRIDVDTDAATKTVTLKGTVPSAAHKASAERIARAKASGYKIRNSLTIGRS